MCGSLQREAYRLLRKLILEYEEYFSHDVLNSEGRKVFEKAVKIILREHPELKQLVSRVRRKPTLENILKIVRVVGVDWELENQV